ncbi:lambda Rz1-like protein [Pseudomonas phage OBP]|uniref:lambda Rz1-like protein n=1 Tax=Pseudomonas phage OBP TaxID=1124849 RepID=UPI000240D560|nr:lambda Rz1-like protein [Pseudomonas phage OBP]AEV89576.1 lambda Rz1-like protein [Pseudomonas phage OBP]
MKIFTVSMGMTKTLILLLLTFMLVACNSQPKITEGGTYVEMKTELAKLDLYRTQLASLKNSLTDVPANVYSKDWKYRESNIGKLDYYLGNNFCLTQDDFKGCYLETRLLLIATTKELDAANDQINGLNQALDRMTGNINSVIDNLQDNKPPGISIKK